MSDETPRFADQKEAREYYRNKGLPQEVVEQLVAPYHWLNRFLGHIGAAPAGDDGLRSRQNNHDEVQRAVAEE